ncbi:hypothetical protein ABE504_14410 [Paenibacillus oryzisoli]|uniref:peptidylprolyl isomerase n=1 Tax=Paenibacillus oryzisoli TaxID=1850517 RepID=UPI003D2E04B1
MTKKSKLIIGLLLMFACLTMIWLMETRDTASIDPNSVVMTIHGEKVSMGEFQFFLNDSVANVFGYFHEKYGAKDSKTFWTRSFQGEIPLDIAKQQTVEKLKVIKAEQILMKQKGLLDDISYEAFLHRLNEENKRRSEAVTKGEVIYGPRQLNEKEYFNYFHSNMMIRLQEWYDKNEGQVTEEALKQTYENWKTTAPNDLKQPDYIQTQLIKVPYGDVEGKQSPLTKDQAKEIASKIHDEIGKGANVESVISSYSSYAEVKSRMFDGTTYRLDNNESEEWLFFEVNSLEKGEISGLIEQPEFFIVIKCNDRKPGDYISIEDSKSMLRTKYLEEKQQHAIDQLVASAMVEIIPNIYANINVK